MLDKSEDAVVYRDDDAAYLDWIARNQDGFVLNMQRSPRANYLVLHRATCRTIQEHTAMARPGGFTERDYIKVCGSRPALSEWAENHFAERVTFGTSCRCLE
ncbi:MAG: hypothetical protein ACF8XB_18055 [Planctomycetota bacterium JB042]